MRGIAAFVSRFHTSLLPSILVRNFMRRKTRNEYIRRVRTFTAFLGRSPDAATAEDLRRCSLAQAGLLTSAVCGARHFQDGGRHQRWRWADAPAAAALRTCLLGVDGGE